MKRNEISKFLFTAALLTAGAALGSICAAAGTEPVLEEVRTIDGYAKIVDGTNLLEMPGDGGHYLADLEGNALTDAAYDYFNQYRYNIEAVRSTDESDIHTHGLFSVEGKELIPCRYGKIDELNNNWAAGYTYTAADEKEYDATNSVWDGNAFKEQYLLIDKADIYFLSDGSASLAATLTRDEFSDLYAVGEYLNLKERQTDSVKMYNADFEVVSSDLQSIYDPGETDAEQGYTTFWENGGTGLKDPEGNIVAEPVYDYISVSGAEDEEPYFLFEKGDSCGLLDANGQVVLDAVYEDIMTNYFADTSRYVCNGYAGVSIDGCLAFTDLEGNLTAQFEAPADEVFFMGTTAIYTDPLQKRHILTADGHDFLMEPPYDTISGISHTDGLLFEYRDTSFNIGIVDWHGNEILPPETTYVGATADGKYLAAGTQDYTSATLYSLNLEPVLAGDVPGTFSENPQDEGKQVEVQTEGSLEDAGLEGILSMLSDNYEENREEAAALISAVRDTLKEDQAGAAPFLDTAVRMLESGTGTVQSAAVILRAAAAYM